RDKAERGKAPSSLRCVSSSDLLGAFPPAPSRRAALAGVSATGLPVPYASPKVGARPGSHVRPFRPRGAGVRRIGDPVGGHYERATRTSSRNSRSSRLATRVLGAFTEPRASVSRGRGIDGRHGDRTRSRNPEAQTRRGRARRRPAAGVVPALDVARRSAG